ITVLQGATNITDGATTPINFGSVTQGQTGPSITFTVRNDGGQILTTSGLAVPTGYTVTDGLSASIYSGQSDTFTIRLDSTVVGTKSGDITFNSNDSNENPFNFAITGVVNASLNAPTSMAVTGSTSSSV